MKKEIVIIVLFFLFPFSLEALEANSLPIESRYVTWVDVKTYKIPVDQKPKWNYDIRWGGQSEPTVFIAETPKHYYPRATFNAQHFNKQKVPLKQRDFKQFSLGALSSIAKNYGYDGPLPEATFYKRGQLRGYQTIVPGTIEGISHDVIIYIAAAPDDTTFSLVAYTQSKKAAHLQNTFDRMAINVEFPAGTLQKFN